MGNCPPYRDGDADNGGRLHWFRQDVMKLLVHRIDFQNLAKKLAHNEIVKLVEKMLALQKECQSVRREEDLDRVCNLEREIARVDKDIDHRVYALYALTEEETENIEK